jgi:hypothetical protein
MSTVRFASWAQPRATAETDVDPADGQPANPADPSARAALTPVISLTNEVTGETREAGGAARIDMLGPEAVAGLEPRQITGRFPVPGSTGSEAINLAAVEFGSIDLPWRFSPARAGSAQRLRPWLVLVVVPIEIAIIPGDPLPTISTPVRHLPDLAESWAWAHVQLDTPTTGRSRLLCPRKLPPDATLWAAVVPAFRGGVQAGLGRRPDPATAYAPAWSPAQADDVVLPVYDHWQFSTGKDADFEFLARRIRPASREALGDFGYRVIDINKPWTGEDPLSDGSAMVAVSGALRPLGDAPAPGVTPGQLSTFASRICDDIAATADGDLGPPLRGGRHVVRAAITPTGGDWLDEANRNPAWRMAAGRGSDWVIANQEQLMAAAWTQAGEIREAAKRLAMSRASVSITESLQGRHLDNLSADELVSVTAPAAQRARLDGAVDQPTLHAALTATAAPGGVASTAMARLLRPTGVIGRRVAAKSTITRAASGDLLQASITATSVSTLASVAHAAPPQAGAANPVTERVTTASINTAARAATSLWVAAKVARHQGVSIATTFTAELAGTPNFLAGPASVSAELAPGDLRAKVALAITRDQLTFSTTAHAPAATAAIRPEGLLVAPASMASLVRASSDAVSAVRRRLATTVRRGGSQVTDLDPVLPTPDVPIPMANAMSDRDPEWFLPGIGKFPLDRANLLSTDSAFVESVFLGANTELLGEFLWREFPTDRRGTPIAHFWPRPDNAADIGQIHQWQGALGSHTTIDETKTVVILIRAELFRRYPTTVVLAAKAESDPNNPNHLRPAGTLDSWLPPIFTLVIDSSTRAIAFPIPRDEVRIPVGPGTPGWFFVLIEPPTSMRFGFDLRSDPPVPPTPGDPSPPASWNDLTWDHVIDARGFASARTAISLQPGQPIPAPQWGGSAACSADVARIAIQRPVRVALHASTMVPTGL